MKKILVSLLFVTVYISANCQNYYYVFFTDKNNVEFNPYDFFDAKAIERRILNNIDLFDKTDFPVNKNYINDVSALSEDFVGESRWFNMVMISASEQNIKAISNFHFVKTVIELQDNVKLLPANYEFSTFENFYNDDDNNNKLTTQLKILQGEYFLNNNINAKGIRIAVFDGGFPEVDKHEAFEHIRKENRIIKTWNFPNKKENVYGWNSHGTMVLSCIAGIKKDGTMLGLATGAEFLLARTEVNAEPKKEEFWWLQAVEWADKNGVNVINSSLGYGIDNHKFTELDGKTTVVAKAANMAASKGILICNSAGNEGSSKSWLKIITPADSDSVLTVGGINNNLTDFLRTSFSSYGPTADGRMKPNVVASGYANVSNPSIDKYTNVAGTSFSSPLTAGFVACAWQTNKNLTAMQLKSEIEKSASLYPYFDYAYGFGVPQASYFIEKNKKQPEKTFEIEENDTCFIIKPISLDVTKTNYLFYNIQNENGTLDFYIQINLNNDEYSNLSNQKNIIIQKNTQLENKTLNIFYNGYYKSMKINNINPKYIINKYPKRDYASYPVSVDVKNQQASKFGNKANYWITGYIAYSMFLPDNNSDFRTGKSHTFDLGLRYKYNVCKKYNLGLNVEYSNSRIALAKSNLSFSENIFNLNWNEENVKIEYNKVRFNRFNLEFYQRLNLASTSLGVLYFDLGVYGSAGVSSNNYIKWKYEDTKLEGKTGLNSEKLNYGLRTRIGYGVIAATVQYRLSDNFNDMFKVPKFNVGVELCLPIR